MKIVIFLCLAILCVTALTVAAEGKSTTFRVMTFNIHHGRGLDKKVDLERIAALIKREKADIVALQEVDKGTQRTDRRDLTAELAKLTGMTGVFSNNFNFQGGQYGNAILSRFPIVDKKNSHYLMLTTNEQRGVLQATIKVNGKKLVFMSTHIDYRPQDAERLMNVAELRQITLNTKFPVIVCGDFNDTPGSRTHNMMSAFLADAWVLAGKDSGFTFEADKPDKRIDMIWLSPKAFTPVNAWVPVSDASDHRPVVVELSFP